MMLLNVIFLHDCPETLHFFFCFMYDCLWVLLFQMNGQMVEYLKVMKADVITYTDKATV